MSTTNITARDVSGMVGHWLGCPPNGYLGSRYGSDVKSLLQTPMATGLADSLIAKAREDIPMLEAMGGNAVNVYSYDVAMDQKVIAFEINGEFVEATGQGYAAQGFDVALVEASEVTLTDGLTDTGSEALYKLIHSTLPSPNYW